MNRTRSISIFVAGIVAMGYVSSSCNQDEDMQSLPVDDLTEERTDQKNGDEQIIKASHPQAVVAWDGKSNASIDLFVLDQEGNDLLICNDSLGGGRKGMNFHVDYKDGRIYGVPYSVSYDPETEQFRSMPLPADFRQPEGDTLFLSMSYIRTGDGPGMILPHMILSGMHVTVGKPETAKFCWYDGTQDAVTMLATKNDDYSEIDSEYVIKFFLNGKQTTFPTVLVR